MNGDSLEIMKAISDSRAEMLKAVGDLHQEFSGFKAEAEVRIKTVEDDQATAETRNWIVTACVIPVITALHYFANRVGFKV